MCRNIKVRPLRPFNLKFKSSFLNQPETCTLYFTVTTGRHFMCDNVTYTGLTFGKHSSGKNQSRDWQCSRLEHSDGCKILTQTAVTQIAKTFLKILVNIVNPTRSSAEANMFPVVRARCSCVRFFFNQLEVPIITSSWVTRSVDWRTPGTGFFLKIIFSS